MKTILVLTLLMLALTTANAQDSTQTELDAKILSDAPGNTKSMITGAAWFGFEANQKKDVKFNFNSYGFSPIFLWKLSDKLFFESEIEINNGAMELEFAKLSYSLNNYMTIGAGRMLSPFGAYGERWEPVFVEKFPNSPLRAEEGLLGGDTHLTWGSIMGMDIRGNIPLGSTKLNYVLFVSNGPSLSKDSGKGGLIDYENLNDNNTNKEVGGRIGFLPLPNLEIGFSGRHGIAGDPSDSLHSKVAATSYAIDLSYVESIEEISSNIGIRGQFTSLSVDKASYPVGDTANSINTFDNNMQNYFVQLSISPAMLTNHFLRNLELLFRYNSLTPPKDAIWGPKDVSGKGGSITRADIGLCYWLSWRVGVRLAYEMTSNPDGTKVNEILGRFVMGF